MVLRNSGRVGSRRFFLKDPLAARNTVARGFLRSGGLEGIGGERRKRGEVGCAVTLHSTSPLSILTSPFY